MCAVKGLKNYIWKLFFISDSEEKAYLSVQRNKSGTLLQYCVATCSYPFSQRILKIVSLKLLYRFYFYLFRYSSLLFFLYKTSSVFNICRGFGVCCFTFVSLALFQFNLIESLTSCFWIKLWRCSHPRKRGEKSKICKKEKIQLKFTGNANTLNWQCTLGRACDLKCFERGLENILDLTFQPLKRYFVTPFANVHNPIKEVYNEVLKNP